MPTPFMHLDFAERMRERLPQPVLDQWPAFYLGSIAADYQAICNVPREVTHFYPLPLLPDYEPAGWPRLLHEHPSLAAVDEMSPSKAAFLAAYAAHLHFDVVWYRQILLPLFVFGDNWNDRSRHERFTGHNTLLTYLDRAALRRLPLAAEATLLQAGSEVELPFVETRELERWQQMIVEQLAPGAGIHTVEIYAARLGIDAEEFGRNLDDPLWLDAHLFCHVPLAQVERVLAETVDESVELIQTYLHPVLNSTAVETLH